MSDVKVTTEVSWNGLEWWEFGSDKLFIPWPKEAYRWEREVCRQGSDMVVRMIRTPPADKPLKEYLRIGPKFGPGVYQNDDRWGQLVDSYSANDWMCVEPAQWAKIQAWQAPLSYDAEAALKKGVSMEDIMSAAGNEIRARMDLTGCKSTIWQMDLPHRPSNKWDDRRRVCAILGMDSDWGLREWTWYECYVGHPLSVLKAKAMNKEASKRRILAGEEHE
jgi:hypothetical protein